MTDLIPAARPVPSPEDRMAAARTDRDYADRIPAPRPLTTDRTNSHHRDLHQHIAGLENDLRSQTRAVLEVTAERDRARADRDRYARTAADLLRQRNEAANQLELTTDERDRHRQELGAAGEVLAVVRDAAERIDRALAVYDTTPGEPEPADDDAAQVAVQNLLDGAAKAFAAADTSSERVEVIRDLLDGWYAAWPDSAVTDPHEPIAWQLASLISAAEAKASAPSSVPPRRAQEPGAWMNRRAVVSDALGRALTGRGYDVPLPVRDRCAEAVLAAQDVALAEREG